MEFLKDMDWVYWLIIVLSFIELILLAVIIAKWPPHQDARPKGKNHPFFVQDDIEIK